MSGCIGTWSRWKWSLSGQNCSVAGWL